MFPLPDARRWTKDQDETLKNDWADHRITLGDIARKFDRTERQVYHRVQSLGLPIPRKNKWPPEKIERLKRLWELGWSSALISRDLDISRNAVIGKKNRLGLSARRPAINEAARTRRAAIAKRRAERAEARKRGKVHREKPMPLPAVKPINPHNPGVTIDGLRWHKGKPANCRAIVHYNLYCGEPNYPGESYCPGHCALHFNGWRPILEAAE